MKLNQHQCKLMQNFKNKKLNEAIETLVKSEEIKLELNFYDNFEITPFMVAARCSLNKNLEYEEQLMWKIAYKEI